jgi:cytochrome c-type biogenesis protein CcmH/NrfG
VSRDNLLFTLLGVVVGFIAAYLLYETVGARQPARLPFGQTAQVPAGAQSAAPPPGAGAAQPGTGPVDAPAMQAQLEQMRQAAEANAEDPAAWLAVANLAFDLRRWEVAVEAYENHLELVPGDPDVMSDLAVSLHGMGRSQEALAMFDRAQQTSPQHWQSRFNEIVVLADLGRLDDAAQVMSELQRMQPENPDVQRLAAELERRRGAA